MVKSASRHVLCLRHQGVLLRFARVYQRIHSCGPPPQMSLT